MARPEWARRGLPTSAWRRPTRAAATSLGRPATEGLAGIPLGALAHLLPAGVGDERVDLVKVMSQVRPVLVEQGQNGPLVLFVDDLHLLDASIASLIRLSARVHASST